MENISIFPQPEVPEKTEIPRNIGNNDVEKYVSLGIAIIPSIVIILFISSILPKYIQSFNLDNYVLSRNLKFPFFSSNINLEGIKASKVFAYLYNFVLLAPYYSLLSANIIIDFVFEIISKSVDGGLAIPILFVFIAAWTSYFIENSLNLENQESINDVYDHRVNEKFSYSLIGLLLAMFLSLGYLTPDSSESVIGYFSGIVVTFIIISILTYFVYDFCKDVIGDSVSTNDKFSASLIFFIYVIFFGLYALIVNSKNKPFFGLLGLLCFGLSIVFLVFAVKDDVKIDNTFDLDSVGDNLPTNYYKCTPLYRSEQIVSDWSNEVKINFDVNINYLNENKTLIQCGDNDDISWKIVYLKESKSFRLDYKNIPSLTIPITYNIINNPPSTGETEAPLASSETEAPVAKQFSTINITMQVRTYKDLNVNSGTILFYHDNNKNQALETQSIYMENMLPPTKWSNVLKTQYYDLVKNVLYCNKDDSVNILNMNPTLKFVYILFFTILATVFILSIIDPRVRIGLFGSKLVPFNIPGIYSKIMQ